MRLVTLLAATCVLLGSANAQQQHPQTATATTDLDLQRIEQLERTDASAAKNNDVEVLSSLWTDDGVLIQPMADPAVGRASITGLLQEQKIHMAAIQFLSYDEDWKERKIQGGTAFEWGSISADLRLPNGNIAHRMVYAARFLVRGNDNIWRFSRVIITQAPRKPDTSATAQ